MKPAIFFSSNVSILSKCGSQDVTYVFQQHLYWGKCDGQDVAYVFQQRLSREKCGRQDVAFSSSISI